METIKVLVVDDSSLVRNILSRGLSMDPQIEVIGTASNPYEARDKIVYLKPDVISLDVEMPRMDGVEFLKRLMPQYPLPVVMVSALTNRGSQITLDALEAGAVDFVLKPSTDIQIGLNGMMDELRTKLKVAAKVDLNKYKKNTFTINQLRKNKASALAETTDKVIAIGASTGGTEALNQLLSVFPANMPGIVIVQHMPAGFTRMFADRLNKTSEMRVKEAQSGDRVMTGHALIAPGNQHMQIIRSGGEYRVICRDGSLVNGHRPSVEVLFRSVAKHVGSNAIGVMLTGMGSDGADAMMRMRQTGARTVAQDQATSVVFGMPKEAYERGGAELLKPLHEIPNVIKQFLKQMADKK